MAARYPLGPMTAPQHSRNPFRPSDLVQRRDEPKEVGIVVSIHPLVVLGSGDLPLEVLDERVDAWISERSGTPR